MIIQPKNNKKKDLIYARITSSNLYLVHILLCVQCFILLLHSSLPFCVYIEQKKIENTQNRKQRAEWKNLNEVALATAMITPVEGVATATATATATRECSVRLRMILWRYWVRCDGNGTVMAGRRRWKKRKI